MSTGRHKNLPPGVPKVIVSGNFTPIHSIELDRPPEVGDPPHLDIEATLREMHMTMQTLQIEVEKGRDGSGSGSLQDDDFISSVADSVAKKNVVAKTLMWIAGIVGTVFSAGMAYAVFIGENATESDVSKALHHAVIEHNSGYDPEDLDQNGVRYGSHPRMRASIESLQKDTAQVKGDVTVIKDAQKRSEKRSEYQYEFSKWQGQILECERTKKCKPPKKPPRLDTLETEIHLGKF
jgi:hypothetical protein